MKKFFFLLSLFYCFFFISLTSYAAEREMNVSLSSGYSQANFYFSFTSEQDYTITITDPNGALVCTTTIKGTEGTIPISNIMTGNYNIKILGTDEIELSESPRVELIKGQVKSEKKAINVSSVVSNLKIWFEDGNLVSSWDDTNIGKVNIQIVNPQTMEVIANSTVEDTYFTTKIANNIETINFYIVPSKSSKIEGAGEMYSVKVIRNVPGEILFPKKTLYNEAVYSFTATLYGNTYVKIFVNEEEQKNSYFEEEGIYDIEIPLTDTENVISVEIIDKDGNLNRYKTLVTRDIVAPKFSINQFDEITKEKSVTIYGKVTEVKEIYINDYPVEVQPNGQFEYVYVLETGYNNICIFASDNAGNIAENNYVVTKVEVNHTPLLIIVSFILLCLSCGFVFKKKILKKKAEEKENSIQNEFELTSEENIDEKKQKNIPSKKKTPKIKIKDWKKIHDNKQPVVPFNLVKKRDLNFVKSNIIVILFFAACFFFFLNKGIMLTTVVSASMEPTLKVGDYVIYNRLAYYLHDVERGDIVCFKSSDNKTFSKRVLGIAGDQISFKDGYLIINGEKVEEMYLQKDIESNSSKEFTVPEGKVFLLGDNRTNSLDSRFWEEPYISLSNIYGKYIGTIKKLF